MIRTLSKAFGLVATSSGVFIGRFYVMSYISRSVAPYPIADPSAEIAQKALSKEGLDESSRQNELIEVRDWFIEALSSLPIGRLIYD